MTLLTATLTWLAAHQRRLDEHAELTLRQQLCTDDSEGEVVSDTAISWAETTPDPPWVVEHAVKSRLADLRAARDARTARLVAARQKERTLRSVDRTGAFRNGEAKKPRLGAASTEAGSEDLKDEKFLPEDMEGEKGKQDGVFLSAEVRDLMAR